MKKNVDRHHDKQLIEAAQQDSAAFVELYEKYVDAIFQFVYYRVGNNHDTAQDLTQEVFIRAFKLLPKFQWQGYPYSAYLYRIARTLCIDYYSEQKHEDLEEAENNIILDSHTVEQTDIQLLWDSIQAQCKPDVIEMLQLRYIHDLSYEEIGVMLNKKPGAIRTRVSRALTSLQETYEQK